MSDGMLYKCMFYSSIMMTRRKITATMVTGMIVIKE